MSKKLTVIIVNWNGKNLLEKCLNSVEKFITGIDYEIIVSDNLSSDDSCKMVKEKFPNVMLLENSQNFGFSIGNNLALKHAVGDYTLFLNPDTELLMPFDMEMFSLLENPEIGVLGCRLLNADRSLQRSVAKFPSFGISLLGLYAYKEGKLLNPISVVDWVMGAFMLLTTENARKVGGFNEDYFMYSEDMELCYKIRKLGKQCVYFQNYEIVHYYNQSGKLLWNNKREIRVRNGLLKFVHDHHTSILRFMTSVAIYLRHQLKSWFSRSE